MCLVLSRFPLAHGRTVVPFGRLLSSPIRLTDSVTAGIWARLIALHSMSFKWLWRCCLGALLRQDSPCSPRTSTALPHTQVCGSQALEPNLWATGYYYTWPWPCSGAAASTVLLVGIVSAVVISIALPPGWDAVSRSALELVIVTACRTHTLLNSILFYFILLGAKSINQSINIRLLRHDKMQANNSKQKGNTVSKKKSRSRK